MSMSGTQSFPKCLGATFLGFLSFTILFFVTAPVFGMDPPIRQIPAGSEVFILNSAHPGHLWSDKETDTIVDQLREKRLSSQPIIEYMGFKRDPQGRHQGELAAKLRRQYESQTFSLIFALDEPALEFSLRHHSDIFGNAPIVFMGVNSFKPEMLRGNTRVTGVVDYADPSGNIEIMLRLHPKTKEILILHDYTPSGLAIRKNYEAILPRFADKVHFRFTDNLPVEAIIKELERMPQDGLVFQLTYTTDQRRATFAQEELTELFSQHSTVPIYDRSATRLGYGIVGGKLIDAQVIGTEAVKLAERILRGEDVRTIPVVYKNSSHYMFDYRQLERFHIPTALLPPDSTIINKPAPLFIEHRNVAIAAAGVMILLAAAVVFLAAYNVQRRRMMNLLRSSEEKYHDLYNNAPDMYLSVDVKTASVIQCNETLLRTTGYTREEVIGRPIFQFYHPDYSEDAKKAFAQFVSTGQVRNVELKACRKDGTAFDISLNASAVRDKDGNITHSRSTWRDITDRKQAEKALVESEELFRSLMDQMTDSLIIIDWNGVVLFSNAAGLKLVELTSAEEAVGRNIVEFIHPDTLQGVLDGLLLVKAGQKGITSECKVITSRGNEKWVEAVGTAVHFRGSDGDMVSIRDITERRRMEQSLLESEQRMRLVTDNVPALIGQVDKNYRYQFVNKNYEEWFGIKRDALIGKQVKDLLPPETYEFSLPFIDRALAGNEVLYESKMRLPNGMVKYFSTHLVPNRSSTDEVTGYYVLVSDITERKQAEEERKRVESQLQQAQKMEAIGTLAGGIAHDFNNLLTGILGHANLLRLNHQPDTKVYEAAKTIERAAERAAELTQQLLGFARRGKYQIQSVNIHEQIQEVIRLLGRTIDKRICVSQRFIPGTPLVKGDPGQLQQVLMNLAINARDAMESGGELSFETGIVNIDEGYCQAHVEAKVGQYLLIAVTDTGFGIPSEQLGRIFEPFYTTKEQGKGSGMGLAMVYGIVKNHEGFVNVYSEVGHGTTFKIYLPLEEGAAAAAEKPDKEGIMPGTGRILLIDDEEMVRGLASEMLTHLGYEVVTADDGEQGVRMYRRADQTFDLVIIDMIMPKLGGRDCFRELKRINPHIKAILSTGYGINGKAQEILNDGVRGFIQKPYRIDQLGRIVKQVLSGS